MLNNNHQHYILASKSPRRHELLRGMGINFEVVDLDADESYPSDLPCHEVAAYISRSKAQAYLEAITKPIITADTIVVLNNEILGKPKDKAEATSMLKKLSGCTHQVYTGVSIRNLNNHIHTFTDCTEVTFREVLDKEIAFYIDNFHPFDKAGSYGIQDWWGLVVVSNIVGSYTNVMGLPTEKLYQALNRI